MRLFNKVAIVGTGLIGGSLALAIKRRGLAREIVGVSRHKKSLLLAKRRGAIDSGSQKLDIIKGADLVIISTPVDVILNLAPKLTAFLKKECIVSDVGSTKGKIVARLEKIFPNFVGSHPLAGSEKRSIANAQACLFKDSLCLLTPTKKTNKKSLQKMNLLWKKVGARTLFLNPQSHDRILAFVSHLPHIVAFSLIDAVPPEFLRFGSGGLKDTTRIAASDSELWAEIFLSNRKNVLQAIGFLQKNISRINSLIKTKNKKKLSLILKRAKEKREVLA
jgi:prephenate dehydrogenase